MLTGSLPPCLLPSPPLAPFTFPHLTCPSQQQSFSLFSLPSLLLPTSLCSPIKALLFPCPQLWTQASFYFTSTAFNLVDHVSLFFPFLLSSCLDTELSFSFDLSHHSSFGPWVPLSRCLPETGSLYLCISITDFHPFSSASSLATTSLFFIFKSLCVCLFV